MPDVLVVPAAVRMLYRVHSHPTHLGMGEEIGRER
jgi:hypothetical protein